MSCLSEPDGRPQAVLSSFLADRRGTVAMVFAMALLPTIGAIGCAIDYGRAVERETLIRSVADSAVLAATSRAALSLKPEEAKALVVNVFEKLSAPSATGVQITTKDVTVTDRTATRTATITFRGSVETSFMKILSFQEMQIGGTAQSVVGLMKPTDVYLLLDNSPSMGLAASTADMEKLRTATTKQWDVFRTDKTNQTRTCEFACHTIDNSAITNDPRFLNYYQLARLPSNNVVLRIDRVREAAQQIVQLAQQKSAGTDVPRQLFRFAIYTYGKTSELTLPAKLTTVQPLTEDLRSAYSAASSVDLMLTSWQQVFDTHSPHAPMLRDLLTAIKLTRDAEGRRRIVMFVSDGVANWHTPDCLATGGVYGVVNNVTTDRCFSPLDPSPCQDIKKEGIDMAVLYTTYLPISQSLTYENSVKKFAPLVEPRMRDCSSGPQFFRTVGTDEDITAALKDLFLSSLSSSRLSQ
jgi:hypothetical protein